MTTNATQEFIGIDELVVKLGLEGKRYNTFRDRVYRKKYLGKSRFLGGGRFA